MKNLLMLLLLVLSFAACNPYKKLDTRPPLSAKDSLLLANRCDQTFPVTPEYIEGEPIHDTIFLDLPSEIDLGEAETLLIVQGYNVDSLKKAIMAECKPRQIRTIRVDTLRIPDSTGTYRERRRADEAIKIAAKAITDKANYEKFVEHKYAKHSMYKFGFFFWPIWLVVIILVYLFSRYGGKLPALRILKKVT